MACRKGFKALANRLLLYSIGRAITSYITPEIKAYTEEDGKAMAWRRNRQPLKNRPDVIAKLAMKYGLRCWYCGYKFREGETINVDHILAHSKGGDDSLINLALACKFCNSHKFYYNVEDFLTWLARIRSPSFECPILQEHYHRIGIIDRDRLEKSKTLRDPFYYEP